VRVDDRARTWRADGEDFAALEGRDRGAVSYKVIEFGVASAVALWGDCGGVFGVASAVAWKDRSRRFIAQRSGPSARAGPSRHKRAAESAALSDEAADAPIVAAKVGWSVGRSVGRSIGRSPRYSGVGSSGGGGGDARRATRGGQRWF
jgi:hypothetical protein